GEDLAVGAECNGLDHSLVLHWRPDGFLGGRVPESRRIVRTRRGEGLAVGAKRHGIDCGIVSHESRKTMNLLAPGVEVEADDLSEIAGIGGGDLKATGQPEHSALRLPLSAEVQALVQGQSGQMPFGVVTLLVGFTPSRLRQDTLLVGFTTS